MLFSVLPSNFILIEGEQVLTLLYASFLFQEFYIKRLHCLLTDFIVLMPLKLKDLRNRADETARTIQVYTHVRYAL